MSPPKPPSPSGPPEPRFVSPSEAVSRRVFFEGRIAKVVDWFGDAGMTRGPQAYLVEQRDYVLRPHFHPVDQFQVLYGAPGSLFGRRPVSALSVHYADAYTVYGPLVGGDPPLRYFTLRAESTDATAFMPESRALLPGRSGRSLHADVDPGGGAAPALLADPRDGLHAELLTGTAEKPLDVPAAGPGGQFLFVVAGTLHSTGRAFGPESIGWHPPGAPGAVLATGGEGASVLVLRYPNPSERSR